MTSLMIMIILLKPLHGGIIVVVHFRRNIGYRIDLVLGSKSIKKRCSEYFIDKKTRHKSWCLAEPRTSDHAPVRVLLD